MHYPGRRDVQRVCQSKPTLLSSKYLSILARDLAQTGGTLTVVRKKLSTTMIASRPLVSLGIPVYNGEDSVRDALDALLAQTYDNLELIISDNASTDRTSEICQEYATKDR